MDRPRSPRRRPEAPIAPTTLTEITRRYYATALALSKAMGMPMSETFLQAHRESISCCFIEAGRAGVRLPPAVQLPPLGVEVAGVTANGQPEAPEPDSDPLPPGAGDAPIASTNGQGPTVIPKDSGLPCAGQVIAELKPPALMMVIIRVAALMHGADRDRWVPLLGALQAERAKRMERGKRRNGEGSQE